MRKYGQMWWNYSKFSTFIRLFMNFCAFLVTTALVISHLRSLKHFLASTHAVDSQHSAALGTSRGT